MHTTEVHIDIPCKDHLDHISRIGSMKFRMNEDVVKIYSGKTRGNVQRWVRTI
jgi:hypothetical protein